MSRIYLTNAPVSEGFTVLPVGEYHVRVTEIDWRKGTVADYLNVEYTILGLADGSDKFAGRKVWENLSLAPQAQFKLKGLLAALGLAVDSFDVDELRGSDLIVKVGIKAETDEFAASNVVRKHVAI